VILLNQVEGDLGTSLPKEDIKEIATASDLGRVGLWAQECPVLISLLIKHVNMEA
jgi:hypothetical protein